MFSGRAAGLMALSLAICLAMSSSQVVRAMVPQLPEGAVRLRSTASIWLADTTSEERDSSAGRFELIKLKSIQELAAIRFDASAAKGRVVESARLFLHQVGPSHLRYVRVSTVAQQWSAGSSRTPYGPASGATYLWADADTKRPWSFPGSEFADVIMGMGHTLTTYAEREMEGDDWISVALTPELVYALANGQTDGLAVADGGTPAFLNNFVHSAEAGRYAPFIDVTPGPPAATTPAPPVVTATSAPARSTLTTGAIRVEIAPAPDTFAWNVRLNGADVPRWQIPFPRDVADSGREQAQIRNARDRSSESAVFYLNTLDPERPYSIEVTSVARTGEVSAASRVSAQSSPALAAPPELGDLRQPEAAAAPIQGGTTFSVWPVPGLVKISPETGLPMAGDLSGDSPASRTNAIWDGQRVRLAGAKGEYVSFQLGVSRLDLARPLTGVTVVPGRLEGPGGSIGGSDIELYRNWYARNSSGDWQPSYVVPIDERARFDIPDRQRQLDGQRNQTIYVDVYVPKHARAGTFNGTFVVQAGRDLAQIPVALEVYDFELPDTLSFWPELNAYAVPPNLLDYHRLAHQHRLVFNPWVIEPRLDGSGRNIKVEWSDYDAAVGPLLSGTAFTGNRRSGVPTPAMYLPFIDKWPTALTRDTYRYAGYWPRQGDPLDGIIQHYLTAPYIGEGLSQEYKDAFTSVERQFIEHFAANGWNRTEMQLFFGGKNTHRLTFGTNLWWTTDEPYHWDDWLAVQFFGALFTTERRALGANPRLWSVRTDLSRPMWAGRVLDGVVDEVYWANLPGRLASERAAWLAENSRLGIRAYGSVNPSSASNSQTVSSLLQVWLKGAKAFLPWQTIGDENSLDVNDNVGGHSLLVPGTRFGLPVIGDIRLKALRDGQQIIEYFAILGERMQLNREQIAAMLERSLSLSSRVAPGSSADDAGAGRFSGLEDWQIAGLRQKLAKMIVATRR